MKRFPPLPSIFIVSALRRLAFLGTVLVLVQPCAGGPGVFVSTGNLGIARTDHTATLLPNGRVLVSGGRNVSGGTAIATTELYDPASGSWTATGSLGTSRFSHSATLLPNGKVLVAGGYNSSGSARPNAELYDPATGTWTATGSLGTARYGHTATLLPNGKLLVTAGRTGSSSIASAELYDPVSGSWTATGGLAAARTFHTATLLPNGKVLVAAGTNGTLENALASAELYDQGPPFITSPLVASGTVGLPLTYQFTASGATSLQIAGPIAPGLTFNTSLGAITGIPTTAGVFQVELNAINSQGVTNATLTLTVQAAPSGLVIISSSCATGRTGRPFRFQLQSSGGSSATRYAVDGLPPGFNVDPTTGFISGTPNPDGSFRLAVSAIDGIATANATLQLTLTSDPTFPIITSAADIVLTPGQPFSYTITSDANGTFGYIGSDGIVHLAPSPSCAGLPPGLCFDGIRTISGVFNPAFGSDRKSPTRPDQTGGIITNVQLFGVNPPNGTGILPLLPLQTTTGAQNIATRLMVGAEQVNFLIAGFIIDRTGPKKVVIRAIGPSLTQFSVPDAMADPVLELFEGNTLLFSNNSWKDNQQQAEQIRLTNLQPTDDREAAILAYLNPGQYTAVIHGNNKSTGIALAEVYDLGTARLFAISDSRLANIATRGKVLGGDGAMIGGFIIVSPNTRIVVRAIGPSLSASGINEPLQDPTLELRNANAFLLGNDNWEDDPTQAEELLLRMLAPTHPLESALVETLQPGGYTAIVRGKEEGARGVAVVQGYVVGP